MPILRREAPRCAGARYAAVSVKNKHEVLGRLRADGCYIGCRRHGRGPCTPIARMPAVLGEVGPRSLKAACGSSGLEQSRKPCGPGLLQTCPILRGEGGCTERGLWAAEYVQRMAR